MQKLKKFVIYTWIEWRREKVVQSSAYELDKGQRTSETKA